MRTSKFTPEQMVHILRQGDSGVPVVELCRQHGISEQTFYLYGLPPVRKGTIERGAGRLAYLYPAS
jgi:putative transposase